MNNPTNDPNDTIKETVNESTQKQCSDIGKVSGIYKIVNKVNGKYYVGSSVDIQRRWKCHKSRLERNKHINAKLQSAYNKYGSDSFVFMLEEVTSSDLFKREQFYLDVCRTNPDVSYNLSFVAGRIEITDEVRKKMSFRARNRSEESKRNMSVAAMGRVFSKEHRKKIGDAQRGSKRSEETKRRMSISQKGKSKPTVKESTRLIHSRNAKQRFENVDYRNKIISNLRPGKSGLESPNTDLTKYKFKHKSGEVFSGTRFEFYKNRCEILPLGVHRLVHKTSKSYKGWKVVS